MDADAIDGGFWTRLFYRWFVQYNPLYLLSAALVLGGMSVIALHVSHDAGPAAQLAVGAIAEAYAFALIGGAALLRRIGLPRPAVMLALITALYQGDLTLHTETCAYLDLAGAFGATAWATLFVIKLYALAWAMKVQPSRSAILVPAFGALGLVALPRGFGVERAHTMGTLVALWMFALLAAGLWTKRTVESTEPLDGWASVVKHRTLRAIWLLWAGLALFHVMFWASQQDLELAWLTPLVALLATRFMRREAWVWVTAAATLLWAGFASPPTFAIAALMAAGVLALRALREPTRVAGAAARAGGPYRVGSAAAAPAVAVAFRLAPRGAAARLLVGALSGVYLSAWTHAWRSGPLPTHVLALDVATTVVVVIAAWKVAYRLAPLPVGALWLHRSLAAGLLPCPVTMLGWGVASVATGFVLLVASLAASYALRPDRPSS